MPEGCVLDERASNHFGYRVWVVPGGDTHDVFVERLPTGPSDDVDELASIMERTPMQQRAARLASAGRSARAMESDDTATTGKQRSSTRRSLAGHRF
jgi:hypothetical protein